MSTVKCDKCGYLVEVEDSTKKYRLPLFFVLLGTVILAYGNAVNTPNIIVTILGCQSATVGLVWLVAARVVSNKDG